METAPMKGHELGQYVCVPSSTCLHSPHITIMSKGVWVKGEGEILVHGLDAMWSSSHADCHEARMRGGVQHGPKSRQTSRQSEGERVPMAKIFTFVIDNFDSPAMADDPGHSEVVRLLRETAQLVRDGRTDGKLRDENGARVGVWGFGEASDE